MTDHRTRIKGNGFMEVVILGSGTCVPRIRRAGPANLLSAWGLNILIDSAAGTLRQLRRAGFRQDAIDIILYTHFHPDHVGELVPFIFASKYGPGFHRSAPVQIMGPEGLLDLHAALKQAFGQWVEPEPGAIEFLEIPVDMKAVQQIPPLTISSIHTRHTPKSLAYRIDAPDGRSVVFSGDTDFCHEIVELAEGADLLILECAAPEGMKVEGHMTPSEAGEVARQAGVRRLLLTHFYPECDRADLVSPCAKRFDGPILLAEDLMRVIV
jgi:ribonuclease BN (tRNA processing enzyme)